MIVFIACYYVAHFSVYLLVRLKEFKITNKPKSSFGSNFAANDGIYFD